MTRPVVSSNTRTMVEGSLSVAALTVRATSISGPDDKRCWPQKAVQGFDSVLDTGGYQGRRMAFITRIDTLSSITPGCYLSSIVSDDAVADLRIWPCGGARNSQPESPPT